MVDLNSDIFEAEICIFCGLYNLKILVEVPTCFKNYINPTCIDLILTNRPINFQNTFVDMIMSILNKQGSFHDQRTTKIHYE